RRRGPHQGPRRRLGGGVELRLSPGQDPPPGGACAWAGRLCGMRVTIGLRDGDWRASQAAAVQAEADGADGVTTPELAHDPFIPLAVAALATSRIELATSVAIAFPRSPMITAN